MQLLTTGNPKTAKGEGLGYLTAIMHLAPAKLSGYNVCPLATPGCEAACLNTAGRGGIGLDAEGLNVIQRARIKRTRWYFEDRAAFMAQLVKELRAHIRRAEKYDLIPVVRLNGTSDIRWETVPVEERGPHGERFAYDNVMMLFPDVQFYDYTKLPNRRNLPPNYHLTYSLAETDSNVLKAKLALDNGYNVAVVLRGAGDGAHPKPFPATYKPKLLPRRKLIDGDKSDLRFLDGRGNYIGLRAKGRAKKDTTGFVKNLPLAS